MADPYDPGGLVDGGSEEMPGVQDRGPADAEAGADLEQSELDTTPESLNADESEPAVGLADNEAAEGPPIS